MTIRFTDLLLDVEWYDELMQTLTLRRKQLQEEYDKLSQKIPPVPPIATTHLYDSIIKLDLLIMCFEKYEK